MRTAVDMAELPIEGDVYVAHLPHVLDAAVAKGVIAEHNRYHQRVHDYRSLQGRRPDRIVVVEEARRHATRPLSQLLLKQVAWLEALGSEVIWVRLP